MRTWGIRTTPLAAISLMGLGLLGLAAIAAPAHAQSFTDPTSGIEFVTVGAVNNPAWTGGGIYNNNRGSVGYVYNIGKFEVTTAQWAEFMNAALDRPSSDRIPHISVPFGWGAVSTTPNTPGGRRWTVPAGNEMIPTGGISWRTAAIYCNWLHNGRGTSRSAFLSGAYDVSTFGIIGGSAFTDQLTRSPGATYWIPSIDEWMKAAHYDPSKPNADGATGGWWLYSNTSDQPFVYGPPGVLRNGLPATANASWDDFTFPGYNPFAVPLGAYANVQSPWGLLDVAGGTSEWTEAIFQIQDEPYPRARILEGSARAIGTNGSDDLVSSPGAGEFPSIPLSDFGFRVATSVPSPGAFSLGFVGWFLSARRKRRPARSTHRA